MATRQAWIRNARRAVTSNRGVTNLLPFSHTGAAGSLRNAIYFGCWITGVNKFTTWYYDGDQLPLGYAIVSALLPVLVYWRLDLLHRDARYARLFLGDPQIVNTPSDGFAYQAPCRWRTEHETEGVLFIGARDLYFSPSKRSTSIAERLPLDELQLSLGTPPSPNWLQRLLRARPAPPILAKSSNGEVAVSLPAPERTIQLLRSKIAELRAA